MNQQERKYIRVLRRRRDYLKDEVIPRYDGKDDSYARAECQALTWIVDQLFEMVSDKDDTEKASQSGSVPN